jgi:hypothetical protein
VVVVAQADSIIVHTLEQAPVAALEFMDKEIQDKDFILRGTDKIVQEAAAWADQAAS